LGGGAEVTRLCVADAYRDSLLRSSLETSFDMTLKLSGNPSSDEAASEFLRWVQDLKKVRDEFEALLDEYEGKRQRLVESLSEETPINPSRS